jgi:hypothetical protein
VASAACRRARCPAWVCGGVGVVGEVRRRADGVGLAAVFGVGLVSGVFGGGWALVPLVMGLLLKVAVACSEVAIALGDAAAVAAYLSAGFRLFGFDGGGGRVGVGCGEGRAAGGFASRRGCAVTCRRLHGGIL